MKQVLEEGARRQHAWPFKSTDPRVCETPTGRVSASQPDTQNIPGTLAAFMEMQYARHGTPWRRPTQPLLKP